MKRSISQVVNRYLPGALLYDDDAEVLGIITTVEGTADEVVDLSRLARSVNRQLDWWSQAGGELRGIEGQLTKQELRPVRPAAVFWAPFPKELVCPQCSRVVDLDDRAFRGPCPACRTQMRQLPYVYIHQCGQLSYLRPLRQINCPRHGRTALTFFDTGRFATALWRCSECIYERGIGIVPCGSCKPNEATKTANLRPTLQGAVWNDPWVYFQQTAKFVNIDEDLAARFVSTPSGQDLLARGAGGTVPAGGNTLVRLLEEEGPRCQHCSTALPPGARFCPGCGSAQVAAPENASVGGLDSSSDITTFALLRDLPQSRSLAWDSRSDAAVRQIAAVRRLDELAIADVVFVANLPVTSGAFGYSRLLSQPPAALRGFPSESGTTPVYTDSRLTEGWLVQLKPGPVRRWLSEAGVAVAPEADGAVDSLRGWVDLAENETYLTLLHSIAHAALLSIARLSGLEDDSLGEILMPGALAFCIFASSGELGALQATFDQSIFAFADGLPLDMDTCRFDPVCSEQHGAACIGCLHIVRGCERYNRALSRAFLITQPTSTVVGFWSHP